MRLIALVILAVMALVSSTADAQEPPTRVGRLAYAEGSVAIYHDPQDGWERAYVNSPLTSENSLWTDLESRAEMRVSGTALRLDELTQLDIAVLDEDDLAAFVPQGSVAVRVRHFDNRSRLDFATPHASFRLYGVGRYRVDVDQEYDETVLTVFAGSASIRSASGDIRVDAGRAVRVFGGPRPSFVHERAHTTAFDRWTLARDDRWIERRSTRYVSTYMTGYEDLDVYGEWAEVPDFGTVWYPSRVSRDWAPYRDGHWEWIPPWGWTWIGYEPWGYAPYHYGRWVYISDRWAWYPGPRRIERPVWAPALVAFVGGSNFSVSIGGSAAPALGWYPLSPWDRYDPWYRTNTTYVNQVNIFVRERPRSERVQRWHEHTHQRGATVVRRDAFIEGRSMRQAAIAVEGDRILRRATQVEDPGRVLPSPREFRRSERYDFQRADRGQAPSVGSAVQPGQPAQGQQRSTSPLARGDRYRPAEQPTFERRQQAPAPVAATEPPQRTSPLARDDERARAARGLDRAEERAAPQGQRGLDRAREAQQQQQRDLAQERAREAQERAAQQAQQQQQRDLAQERAREAQERAAQQAQQRQQRDLAQERAREAQERGAQQQRQRDLAQERAGQAQQAQERAAREAEREQQRAAREAQQQQQRAAREAQQQQERDLVQERARQAQQAQEQAAQQAQREQQRAAREAQQQQQRDLAQERARQAQQAQQAQERSAQQAQREQERAAQQAQREQQRAAREAQQQQQREAQERASEAQRAAQQAQAQAAQQAQQPQVSQNPQGRGPGGPPSAPERGRGGDRDEPPGKGRGGGGDDGEEPGKGRGRDR